MTTLESIGFTLAGGSAVLVTSLGLFGLALKKQTPLIAPRATARPPQVIYRPLPKRKCGQKKRKSQTQTRRGRRNPRGEPDDENAAGSDPHQQAHDEEEEKDEEENDQHPYEPGHDEEANPGDDDEKWGDLPDRGDPFTGWIGWTLSLDYDTLWRGVPGTGTRRGGRAGSLLRVQLDGILLLRFHALGLRISALATILMLTLLLPLYLSAQCYNIDENDTQQRMTCSADVYNLTNYERTTIANIPSLGGSGTGGSVKHDQNSPNLIRLYFVVACFWSLIIYTCHQLHQEWITMLALRRVYYLEHDIWRERREELKQTLLYRQRDHQQKAQEQQKKDRRLSQDVPPLSTSSSMASTWHHHHHRHHEPPQQQQQPQHRPRFTFDDPYDPDDEVNQAQQQHQPEWHLLQREPWIPHPEQRDTVPNVSLYSVLVGGLPSLPEQAANSMDRKATVQFSQRESLDWQLSITTAFFDHCVPNQPGFSSSVAAVTIIPGAQDLAMAWRKWYSAAAKLRRLRFIREQIDRWRHYEIQDVVHEDDRKDEEQGTVGGEDGGSRRPLPSVTSTSIKMMPSPDGHLSVATSRIYADTERNREYFREVLGSFADMQAESHTQESLAFGPEQYAVYNREFAQAAAACCPYGCCEGRVRRARIDELLEMEREVAAQLHQANLELREARLRAARTDLTETKPPLLPPPRSSLEAPSTMMTDGGVGSTNLEQEQQTIQSSVHSPMTARKPLRKAPSLEGFQYPSDLDLEAELMKHSSHGAAISTHESKHPTATLPVQPHAPEEAVTADWPPAPPIPAMAAETKWSEVERIVSESLSVSKTSASGSFTSKRHIGSGAWSWPSLRRVFSRTKQGVTAAKDWARKESTAAVDDLARESTYAVVTFTSRQAAVAARYCLADGRGVHRWVTLKEMPIPPLADAAPWDLQVCRNCCRPLALSINDRQKALRYYCVITLLVVINIFYTFPLTFASSLVDPQKLDKIFPAFSEWSQNSGLQISSLVSGLWVAMIWSTFFASCPIMFKAIANFGSGATSVAAAEFKALQYYWYFMVITAFSGQLLLQMFLDVLNNNLKFGSEFRSLLREIALTVPSTIAVSWLNWIIYRFTVTLPLNYILQMNTFLFHAAGLICCSRVVRGGGPGGPTPYRIYVDSGMAVMCLLALAPASPILAPAIFAYFLVCQPMLRQNLIFVYRPRFDSGGVRWPFLFDMMVVCMMVGTLLLAVQLGLKEAVGPTAACALTMIPIYIFSVATKKRFLRAYEETALLQTSLLDGWDSGEESTLEQREEFRRFLVDAHKAAYVPVCLAGTEMDELLTAEPAVVLPLESELVPTTKDWTAAPPAAEVMDEVALRSESPSETLAQRRKSQPGATLRRAARRLSMLPNVTTTRRRESSMGSSYLSSSWHQEDDFSLISPFEKSCWMGRESSTAHKSE